MMVEVMAAVRNDGVVCAHRCEKLRRRGESTSVMPGLENIRSQVGVLREQDVLGQLAGVAHEQHAKRMSASAIALEHCDE
jgi:hypothetical protein